MTPGEELKYYRKRKGLTQEQIAEDLCITQAQVCQIERGKRSISPVIMDILVEAGIIEKGADERIEEIKDIYNNMNSMDQNLAYSIIKRMVR